MVQSSCLDAYVNVRDGPDVNASELVSRFGFFERASGFEFNTTQPTATFEFRADDDACRLNMELEVVAVGEEVKNIPKVRDSSKKKVFKFSCALKNVLISLK